MRAFFLGCGVIALSIFFFASGAKAQYTPPQSKIDTSKAYDPRMVSTNFTGVWDPTDSGANLTKDEPPMKPNALAFYHAQKTEYSKPPVGDDENTDPLFRCEPGSVPRFYFNGHSMDFVQTPEAIVQLIETYRNFRIFYLDGRKHSDSDTWYGDSNAVWDGNTLVVTTTDFNDRSWLDKPGHPHSDQLVLTERMARTSVDHLKIDINIHDPVYYTADWGGQKNFVYKPGWEILNYLCSPEDEEALFGQVRNKATNRKGPPAGESESK